MLEENPKASVPFQYIIDALLDKKQSFPPKYLARFSDLKPEELRMVAEAWTQIELKKRLSLLKDLEEYADSDTLVCYDELGRFALKDPDAPVKIQAMKLLKECEDAHLIPDLLRTLKTDEDESVRSAAAFALGNFVYLGELDEIPAHKLEEIEETLLEILAEGNSDQVRKRALEAMGFSSREEMPAIINNAYLSSDHEWKLSAMFAMGRSADNRWEKIVLKHLRDSDSEMQLEAVRAAGALELTSAKDTLIELLEQADDLDIDVKDIAIWSISQIGGENVREALVSLMESAETEEDEEYINSALENLDLTEGLGGFDLMDISYPDDINDGEDDLTDDVTDNFFDDDAEDTEFEED